jgi:hypothetical protein
MVPLLSNHLNTLLGVIVADKEKKKRRHSQFGFEHLEQELLAKMYYNYHHIDFEKTGRKIHQPPPSIMLPEIMKDCKDDFDAFCYKESKIDWRSTERLRKQEFENKRKEDASLKWDNFEKECRKKFEIERNIKNKNDWSRFKRNWMFNFNKKWDYEFEMEEGKINYTYDELESFILCGKKKLSNILKNFEKFGLIISSVPVFNDNVKISRMFVKLKPQYKIYYCQIIKSIKEMKEQMNSLQKDINESSKENNKGEKDTDFKNQMVLHLKKRIKSKEMIKMNLLYQHATGRKKTDSKKRMIFMTTRGETLAKILLKEPLTIFTDEGLINVGIDFMPTDDNRLFKNKEWKEILKESISTSYQRKNKKKETQGNNPSS